MCLPSKFFIVCKQFKLGCLVTCPYSSRECATKTYEQNIEAAQTTQTFTQIYNQNVIKFTRNWTYIDRKVFEQTVKEWLQQQKTIPSILCQNMCRKACKLCVLDDALSKTELLEELK